MLRGALTSYIDVAQMVLYAFWLFFSGLVFYLRREDRREGYPLESEPAGFRPTPMLFLWIPEPKTFHKAEGGVALAPRVETDTRSLNAVKTAVWPGAPLDPVGDPMLAEIGPGAYALRADIAEKAHDGEPLIVPLRVAANYAVAVEDNTPIGFNVIGADGQIAGTVADLWIDRAETVIRYYEVALSIGGAPHHVLLPATFKTVKSWEKEVHVDAILAHQFANVPVTRNPDTVTLLEEEKITAYYAAGTLYATPQRTEPLL
jgi:photosynthetic reaction center H subunit